MSNILKRCLSILLLIVFLIPSAGIMIYMRHCNFSGKTSIAIESSACCSKPASNTVDHKCGSLYAATNSDQATLTKTRCCDNSNIYLKLGAHLAVERLLLNNLFPALIAIQKHDALTPLYSLYNSKCSYWDNNPPWNDALEKYSPLRL